jgi:CheY-like chemotaxis protein
LGALRNIDRAQASADRAATLIDRLLTFARRQALQPRLVDPNRLVAGISNMIESVVGENIDVETVLAGGVWRINVDQNRLESALLNLVINARDAIGQRGKITIETANAFLDAAYAAGEHEVMPGQYVLLAVSDTGCGMTREVLSHAFEPFYTTKDVGQGSGLGLSQVFGFVKQSGGHVKIYSEIDQGTTIRMYLPRFVGSELALPEQGAVPAPLLKAQGQETILVVEDEAEVRAYACDVLTQLGYRVLDAQDARSGLAILAANPDIALLLTDVGLPGMNGRDLATEAHQHRPDLHVLYMTGYAANAVVHSGTFDPGAQLLSKPFNMAELGNRVSEMLNGAVSV